MSDPVYGDQFAALRREVERLRAELDAERAVSESRRKVLAEKADGMRAEWLRAERAEGEVERLRSQLDATAQAHERDVVRLARALGWTHEPPASVDEVVERAAALHTEALKARTTIERLTREAEGRDAQLAAARRACDRRAWQVKERARAVAHSTDDAHVIRRLLTELGTDERSQPDPAAQRDEALAAGLTGDDGAR